MKINFSPQFFKNTVQKSSQLISNISSNSAAKNHFDTINISKSSDTSVNSVATQQNSGDSSNTKVELIRSKLKRGEELSSSELSFLKQNSPGLYDQAVKIAQERKEYKQQLQSCKTKQDVEKAKNLKMNRFAKEIEAINRAPISQSEKEEKLEIVKMRQAAIENEHQKFIKTSHYKALKETDDDPEKANAIKESAEESLLNQVK